MLQHLDPYEQTIVYIVLCIVITRSIDLNCSWLAFQTSKAAQKRKKKIQKLETSFKIRDYWICEATGRETIETSNGY